MDPAVNSTDTVDDATWMLVLSILVIAVLVGVGLLQVYLSGDYGSLFRSIGIGLLLLLFSVGFYRKWHGT
ncbi:hypothetical protein C476_03498 [Natrinema limicola JCM 13563]|uniref:DUF8073 domain-containing protein n=1 Tax=Natrinema limicola JCM 13563 TaxID=1230457 RepID=M0CS27_9EURY|nr:hypothetical protein C476_03498 [Natrinema limicola JCM 13563]